MANINCMCACIVGNIRPLWNKNLWQNNSNDVVIAVDSTKSDVDIEFPPHT